MAQSKVISEFWVRVSVIIGQSIKTKTSSKSFSLEKLLFNLLLGLILQANFDPVFSIELRCRDTSSNFLV